MQAAKENPATMPWWQLGVGAVVLGGVAGAIGFMWGAAAQVGKNQASSAGAAFNQANAAPVPLGQNMNASVGSSLITTSVQSGNVVSTPAVSNNTAVLAPAPNTSWGFVAIAPGAATLTPAAGGPSSIVTVVPAVGTSGTPKGVAGPVRPPLLSLFGLRPKRVAA